MNITLINALVGLASTSALLSAAVQLFFKRRTVSLSLQLMGAGCLVIVVLTHVFEALQLSTRMQWGSEHSVCHYLDFATALGLTLFPVGYLFHALRTDAPKSAAEIIVATISGPKVAMNSADE